MVDKVKELEKDNAELALKIPKPKTPTKRDLFDNFILYGVLSAIGLSLVHSVYSLGLWGWKAVTAPSQTTEISGKAVLDEKIHQAALQCALKQRALVKGRPTVPLGPEDRLLPPPAALKPMPANFLSVGHAAKMSSWQGVAFKEGKIELTQRGIIGGSYSLHITGNIVNLSPHYIDEIGGEWYVVGLRGPELECEPLKSGNVYQEMKMIEPGNSDTFDFTVSNALPPPPGEDIIVKVFANFYPDFVGE